MIVHATDLLLLAILALPVASISWTVTHEEVFREPHDYCVEKFKTSRNILVRKFFYLFTCEYCFSHYVAAFFVALTDFHLVFKDWRGYLIGGFALVWVANVLMNLFARIRIDIKAERLDANLKEEQLKTAVATNEEVVASTE
ncbi:MAG: hypothetical protein SGJ05_03800 [bacterium]|nr:hypothetical protein [bacterium]